MRSSRCSTRSARATSSCGPTASRRCTRCTTAWDSPDGRSTDGRTSIVGPRGGPRAHNPSSMAPQTIVRWSGIALILGGVLLALFMIVHPFGEIAGAHAAHSPRWVPAHTLHFLGALATTLGLPGLYARQMRETGRL